MMPAKTPVAIPSPIVAQVPDMACGLAMDTMLRAMFQGSMMNGTDITPARTQRRYIHRIWMAHFERGRYEKGLLSRGILRRIVKKMSENVPIGQTEAQ